MLYWRRLFSKILDDGGGGSPPTLESKSHHIKGSHLIKMCFLFLFVGCASDISIIEQRESDVVIDSFIQASQIDSLDILVVVDTSGSMYDNFDDVGIGMDTLRIDIENLTYDYQFGFITTDPDRLSYLGPFDSSASSIDIMLATALLDSAPGESGFSSTYVFLNSEEGLDFARPESDFLLFLVSDEDEQGPITSLIFKDWLSDTFLDASHDIVAITTKSEGLCTSNYDIGFKYTELAVLYGKDSIDICDESWSVWLSESSFITRQVDYIRLSADDPIIESLVVYENHIITSDWLYEEEENIIQLGFLPEAGDLIEVGYKVYTK
jgi:hypothetical protein